MEKRIRNVELADAEAVRNIYAPFVLSTATSFETELPTLDMMTERIRNLQVRFPWLVFEIPGAVLGYAYASSHRSRQAYQWSVEVSVYVDENARQRGIGRALYLSLFELLRRQGYVNAYAGITLPNPASLRLHQSLGFTSVGVFSRIGFKFGQWHDVAWLQLRLSDPKTPIPEPHPINTLSDPDLKCLLSRYASSVKDGSISSASSSSL